MIKGFHQHFQSLAKTTVNPKFDYEFNELVQYEYTQITELVKGKGVSEVSMDELKRSINAINKGKA